MFCTGVYNDFSHNSWFLAGFLFMCSFLAMMRRLTIWMTAMCGRKEGCNQPVHQPQVSPPTFILVIIIASHMLVVLIAKSQLLDRGRCSGVKNCNAQFIVNLSTASNGQRCHINERSGLGKPSCKKTDVFSWQEEEKAIQDMEGGGKSNILIATMWNSKKRPQNVVSGSFGEHFLHHQIEVAHSIRFLNLQKKN